MEFRRIFYSDGAHDEIPVDAVEQEGDLIVFMHGTDQVIRVNLDDLVTIEGR